MEGKTHALTVRDVKLSEAGEVKLTAKDFQTQAKLTVGGKAETLLTLPVTHRGNTVFSNITTTLTHRGNTQTLLSSWMALD